FSCVVAHRTARVRNVQNGATRYDLGPLERNPPGDTVSRGSKSAAPWSRSTSSSLPHEGRVPEPQEERATLRLRLLSVASGTRYNRAAGEASSSEPSGVLGEGSLRSLGSGRRVRARPKQDGRLPPRRRGRAIRHASPAPLERTRVAPRRLVAQTSRGSMEGAP